MSALNLRPAESEPTSQIKPRVLVADDSRVIRMAINRILGSDYELVEVGDGESAWGRLQEDTELQALVTDIEMPKIDGYELIRRIRGAAESRLRELPVIAITGAEDEETKQRAFACGATDFIIKPIDAIQLKARVKAYIRYDRTVREQTEKTSILEDQSIVDSATGLYSKRYLSQRGSQDLAFSVRSGNDLSLIRLDIDHFKKLYKTHGDDVSEDLLTWFAKVLFKCARTEDTVARISGTQFAVLASAISIDKAAVICQRLQETLDSQPYRHGKITIPVTVSMGIASLMQDRRDNFLELLMLAQQRLCHAQSEGGDRVCSSILSGSSEIEEVVVPSLETQAEADSVDSLQDAVPEVMANHDSGFNLDIIGMDTTEADMSLVGDSAELDLQLEADEVPVSADLQAISELSIEDLDSPAVEYMPDLSLAEDAADSPAVDLSLNETTTLLIEPEQSLSTDSLSIDRALQLIETGKVELVAPNLEALLKRIKPLMDLSKEVR